MNLYLIALSPFALLACAAALFIILNTLGGSIGNVIFALLTGSLFLLWLHRKNAVSAFFDSQLAGLIGLINSAHSTSGVYNRIT